MLAIQPVHPGDTPHDGQTVGSHVYIRTTARIRFWEQTRWQERTVPWDVGTRSAQQGALHEKVGSPSG